MSTHYVLKRYTICVCRFCAFCTRFVFSIDILHICGFSFYSYFKEKNFGKFSKIFFYYTAGYSTKYDTKKSALPKESALTLYISLR